MDISILFVIFSVLLFIIIMKGMDVFKFLKQSENELLEKLKGISDEEK